MHTGQYPANQEVGSFIPPQIQMLFTHIHGGALKPLIWLLAWKIHTQASNGAGSKSHQDAPGYSSSSLGWQTLGIFGISYQGGGSQLTPATETCWVLAPREATMKIIISPGGSPQAGPLGVRKAWESCLQGRVSFLKSLTPHMNCLLWQAQSSKCKLPQLNTEPCTPRRKSPCKRE